jgi:hypothetical protein
MRDGWMDGGWPGNSFPLGSRSLANHSGYLSFCFYYLPTYQNLVPREAPQSNFQIHQETYPNNPCSDYHCTVLKLRFSQQRLESLMQAWAPEIADPQTLHTSVHINPKTLWAEQKMWAEFTNFLNCFLGFFFRNRTR